MLGLEVMQVMAVSFSTCTDSQAHCIGQDAGRVLVWVNWWASQGDGKVQPQAELSRRSNAGTVTGSRPVPLIPGRLTRFQPQTQCQ